MRTRLIILIIFLSIFTVTRKSPISSSGQSNIALEDLVFVTEDDYHPEPSGCDAVSVFSIDSKTPVYSGDQVISPGRLAANSDFSLIMASFSNYGGGDRSPSQPFIYLLRGTSLDRDQWAYGGYILMGKETPWQSAIAIMPDDDTLLLPHVGEPRPRLGWQPPYEVRKYRISETSEQALGPDHGRAELDGIAVEIFPSRDNRSAHVVTEMTSVYSINTITMQETDQPIHMKPYGRQALGSVPGVVPSYYLSIAQAAMSLDERYIITNRWMMPELQVADLVTRKAYTATVPNVKTTGGIAINHGPDNAGLLALHAVDQVIVFKIDFPNTLTELSRISVNPALAEAGFPGGPKASIAWSGSGSDIIVAADLGSEGEFLVIEVKDGGRTLLPKLKLEACTTPFNNQPNDILTANGRLVTPVTPTSTVPPHPTPSPSPPPSDTATASPTPARTLTATDPPTATASPTQTATATSSPMPIYLPIALREVPCLPERFPTDTVMIIDTSSSMTGAKLDAAKTAARAFVAALRLPGDRVALVAFNAQAQLVLTLSDDPAAIDIAIKALHTTPGTRIDRGLAAALSELQGPRHHPDHSLAIVLLTDGRQEDDPASAQSVATAARSVGITIYAVGLGVDVDRDYLTALAGTPDHYYFAPDGAELAKIYQAIAKVIPCPAERYWARRP